MLFPTEQAIGPIELARAVEERGLYSLYFPEHTHIPVGRRTPYPGGGELPEEYKRTLDPFVALGQAAAVTERLALGTGITLIAQHDPIDLAKQVATLDHLSGGRLTLGIGFAVNDSGIVVPALGISVAVPLLVTISADWLLRLRRRVVDAQARSSQVGSAQAGSTQAGSVQPREGRTLDTTP